MTKQLVFPWAQGDVLMHAATRKRITREVVDALTARLAKQAEGVCERVLTNELERTVAAVFEREASRLLADQRTILDDVIHAFRIFGDRINSWRDRDETERWWMHGGEPPWQSSDDEEEHDD